MHDSHIFLLSLSYVSAASHRRVQLSGTQIVFAFHLKKSSIHKTTPNREAVFARLIRDAVDADGLYTGYTSNELVSVLGHEPDELGFVPCGVRDRFAP